MKKILFSLTTIFCLLAIIMAGDLCAQQTQVGIGGQQQQQQSQQQQGQLQGQLQGQVVGSPVTGSPSATIVGGTSVIPENLRQFNIGTPVPMPNIPSYFGPFTPDVNFQKSEIFARFFKDVDKSMAEALIKGEGKGKVKSKPKCLVGNLAKEPVGGTIRIVVAEPADLLKKYTPVGQNSVYADNVKTDTPECIGKAVLDGLRMNATLMLITGEGAAAVLKAFGWGIGINNTLSTISGPGQAVGNAAAGGLGVSGVESGYRTKPWIQTYYFTDAI